MERLTTLREALEAADASPYDAALFLPPDEVWSLDTPCAVLEVDPHEEGEAPPPFARQHGLSRALSVAQVQDIVGNAHQQVAEPSPEQLLAAFLFYYDRDAFIVFGGGRDA
jgi:hypothetical protein